MFELGDESSACVHRPAIAESAVASIGFVCLQSETVANEPGGDETVLKRNATAGCRISKTFPNSINARWFKNTGFIPVLFSTGLDYPQNSWKQVLNRRRHFDNRRNRRRCAVLYDRRSRCSILISAEPNFLVTSVHR